MKPVALVPDYHWNSVPPETFQELESTFRLFAVVLPSWVCLPGEGAKAEASSTQISLKASKTHNELHRELLLAHRRYQHDRTFLSTLLQSGSPDVLYYEFTNVSFTRVLSNTPPPYCPGPLAAPEN